MSHHWSPKRVRDLSTNEEKITLVDVHTKEKMAHLSHLFKAKVYDILGEDKEKGILTIGKDGVSTHEIHMPLYYVRQELLRTKDQQPKKTKEVLDSFFLDHIVYDTWVNGYHMIFSRHIDNGGRKFVVALVEIERGYYVPRYFYKSYSDLSWRVTSHIEVDDGSVRYAKGREVHYVQDTKLSLDIEQILNQLSYTSTIEIDRTIDELIAREDDLEHIIYENGKARPLSSSFEHQQKTFPDFQDKDWNKVMETLQFVYRLFGAINWKKTRRVASRVYDAPYLIKKYREDAISSNNPFFFSKKDYDVPRVVYHAQACMEQELQKHYGIGLSEEVKKKHAEVVRLLKNHDGESPLFAPYNEQTAVYADAYTAWATSFFKDVISKIRFPESMIPNFTPEECIATTYDADYNISIERYKVTSSQGDSIYIDMASQRNGERVWIHNCSLVSSPVNSYGAMQELLHMGILVYKPEDYDFQVQGLVADPEKERGRNGYVDISWLWEEFELVRRYKEMKSKSDTIKTATPAKTISPWENQIMERNIKQREDDEEKEFKQKLREDISLRMLVQDPKQFVSLCKIYTFHVLEEHLNKFL